jgi:hypothetical protein
MDFRHVTFDGSSLFWSIAMIGLRSLVGCLLMALNAALATAQDDARSIILKALQAAGMPNDNKVYHETWVEKGKMTAMGMTMPYDSKWTFEAPSRYRFDMKMSFQGQNAEITFIQNGPKAKQSGMGRTEMVTGEKLEETTHSAYQFTVCSLRPLLHEKEFQFAVVNENTFAGKPVTSVKVSKAAKRDVTLHFDKKTNLLVGCSDRVKDEFQNWKEVPQETEFSDYEKGPGGELFFKKMIVKRDGKVMLESTFSDYKRSEALKSDLFKLD